MSDIIRISKVGLYETVRCAICKNPNQTERGCDGACQVDKELHEKIVEAVIGIAEPERPHGEWEALGFQQGYAFCRCSNCHKTTRLYRDSKNEFCCIADIRKKVVSCMYCGADMSANDRQVTGKLNSKIEKSKSEIVPDYRDGWRLKEGEAE